MQSFAKIIGIFESHEYNAPMDMGREHGYVETSRYAVWIPIGIQLYGPILVEWNQEQTRILELHELVASMMHPYYESSYDVITIVLHHNLGRVQENYGQNQSSISQLLVVWVIEYM